MRLIVGALALLLAGMLACMVTSEAEAQGYAYDPYGGSYVEQVIRDVWPDHEEDLAVAVAACESGLDPHAYNPASGAYGPWQFLASTSYGMGFDHSLMYDPVYATQAAYQLRQQMGWSPWVCAW